MSGSPERADSRMIGTGLPAARRRWHTSKPWTVGDHQIEDHEIDPFLDPLQGDPAVGGGHRVEALELQVQLEAPQDGGIVLHHQDPGGHTSPYPDLLPSGQPGRSHLILFLPCMAACGLRVGQIAAAPVGPATDSASSATGPSPWRWWGRGRRPPTICSRCWRPATPPWCSSRGTRWRDRGVPDFNRLMARTEGLAIAPVVGVGERIGDRALRGTSPRGPTWGSATSGDRSRGTRWTS